MSKKTILFLILTLFSAIGIGLIVISIKPAIKTVTNYSAKLLPTIVPTTSVATNLESAKVERVIDGDTIVLTNGSKVRYIGINTPEIVDPQKPVECFGSEAFEKNKQLVSEKDVLLERDISDKDKYGRLLRYVYIQNTVNDKIMVNEQLVRQGFAKADVYKPDIKYQDVFAKDQQLAKAQVLGLWGACKQ